MNKIYKYYVKASCTQKLSKDVHNIVCIISAIHNYGRLFCSRKDFYFTTFVMCWVKIIERTRNLIRLTPKVIETQLAYTKQCYFRFIIILSFKNPIALSACYFLHYKKLGIKVTSCRFQTIKNQLTSLIMKYF